MPSATPPFRDVRPGLGTVAARAAPALLGTALLVLVAGCEEIEEIADEYRPMTPHEAYAASLREAGLGGTALAREWLSAAESAASDPAPVALPYREEGWFPPESPAAAGYRVSLERGQLLTIELEVTEPVGADSTRLFVDLMRVPDEASGPLRPVRRVDTLSTGRFQYEPYREGDYVVRLQPELLAGGRFRVSLHLDPALTFPVLGHDDRDIQSFFGADRDGGRRRHHGVDIFAPRGTPVLAATEGVVRRANETPRGGKVVWLGDSRRSQSIYYAHLDSQTVRRGDRVAAGDTLGFVGNSGNARTTPPHLHFGLYQRGRGPVDPLIYVREVRDPPPAWPGEPDRIGGWVRTRSAVDLREGPTPSGVAEELGVGTPLRVMGGGEGWWRVRLPDGRTGYLASRSTEALEQPMAERRAAAGERVLAGPTVDAPVVTPLEEGSTIAVLGRYGGYELVEARAPDGRRWRGWSHPSTPSP